MEQSPRPRLSVAALLALGLGVSSLGGLFCFSGVPAVWLGLRALRAVNGSYGRLRGARLALAGMALGVVGTLIAVFGGVAIVAVHLNQQSRYAESRDNLRRIGAALNRYAEGQGTFPAATREPEKLDPDRRLSWIADVLPRFDEDKKSGAAFVDLAKKIDRAAAWDAPENQEARKTTLKVLLSRAYPEYRAGPVTHYVGLAGLGERAAYLKRSDAKAGVFGHDRGVRRVEMEGGISYTAMAAETTFENGPWIAGDRPTVRGLGDEDHYGGRGRAFGGLHPAGTLLLYADGSARAMSDDADAGVWRRLVTLGRE